MTAIGLRIQCLVLLRGPMIFTGRKAPKWKLPTWTTQPGGSFVIEAKAATLVSQDDCRAMLRTLLADRFKLRMHTEQRPGSFYELVLGPGIPRMQQVDESFKEQGVFITIDDEPRRGRPGAPSLRAMSMDFFANIWESGRRMGSESLTRPDSKASTK
jgi:uncharacterized protein (TIGR03435 family)